MAKSITDEDLDLLGELGVETESVKSGGLSAREQRVIAGFEEIECFVEKHGRLPQHGEDRDIFERLYAVRLEQIRNSVECLEVLKERDSRGLLKSVMDENGAEMLGEEASQYGGKVEVEDALSDDELLSILGVREGDGMDIMDLKYVRTAEEKQLAEEVAQRTHCKEFEKFKFIFEMAQRELKSGVRQTKRFEGNAEVKLGNLFILDGQMAYVEFLGDEFVSVKGKKNRRLRVIYSNGTENDILLRSFVRALNKDKTSRRIIKQSLSVGPLFSDEEEEGDLSSGCIYVLRSQSTHPFVEENRIVLHKIGVTGGDVKTRIANAVKDPTYLLAEVEIVATYKLVNMNRVKLEQLLHKFFASARLDLELKDRFGFEVTPREWFLIPFPVIEECMGKLRDGTLADFRYDASQGAIVPL